MSNSGNNNSGNSIFSYITPWIGRILGIVILIVVIIAIAKLLGGNIFGALQGIVGTADAAAHALTNQITACGFAAPPNTSCDASAKTTGCLVSQKCVDGQCTECTEDSQCSPGTCASTKMCQAPGGIGGLFNSGCMIGTLFVGYFALQVLIPIAGLLFGWVKSKFANKIEAITGKSALDGVPVDNIVKDVAEAADEATDKHIEEMQKKKKLPYKDSKGKWRDADGNEISEADAQAKINEARETYKKSYLKDVTERVLTRSISNEAKSKMSQSQEAQNAINQATEERVAERNRQLDEDAASNEHTLDADEVEDAANDFVPEDMPA